MAFELRRLISEVNSHEDITMAAGVLPGQFINVLLTPRDGDVLSKEMQLEWQRVGNEMIKHNAEQILTTATIDSLGVAIRALAFPSQWYPALYLLTAWVR